MMAQQRSCAILTQNVSRPNQQIKRICPRNTNQAHVKDTKPTNKNDDQQKRRSQLVTHSTLM